MAQHPFIPYAKQSISSSDIEKVGQALRGDVITRGSHVEAFEKAISLYCNAEYAVAFNSGTTALLAAGYAAEISPSDCLITSPNTFIATISSGMLRQASPTLVDIDRNTGNLDIQQIKHALKERYSSRGKTVIVPVHFSGIPVDMFSLDQCIHSPSTVVIEDAAHALGSRYQDGQMVGCCAWSHMTIFSFHPAKTITTGEGGIVTTNDPNLYYRLRLFRNNGIERDLNILCRDPSSVYEGYYEVLDLTGNYNFTDFQAALGLSQLQRIDQFITKRRELISHYRRLLKDVPHIRLFDADYDHRTAFALCVVQIDFAYYNTSRALVMQKLKEEGVGTQLHYIPIYSHPCFQQNNIDVNKHFPNMETYYAQALSLPLYYDLTLEEVESIVHKLTDLLFKSKKQQIFN